MLELSADPRLAEQQMQAVLFFLAVFGYIDGDFDDRERDFVRQYVRSAVEHRVRSAVEGNGGDATPDTTERWTAHFLELFEKLDQEIGDLLVEEVGRGEERSDVIYARMKVRCFEILEEFDHAGREALLDIIDQLVAVDGTVHPAELAFRAELAELLEADLGIELVEEDEEDTGPIQLAVDLPVRPGHTPQTGTLFDPLEENYSADPETLARQLGADLERLAHAEALLAAQRQAGYGKLAGHTRVEQLSGEAPFLDGHVYVVPPRAGRTYEVTVLGDLHGCYTCLKAAVLQSRFLEKVDAFRRDPAGRPEPMLVLLGDYLDRGRFSYEGVLRAAAELFCRAPGHVFLLRGNHEFYVESDGQIASGVHPSEAIATLAPHAGPEAFSAFKTFFELLPNMLFLDGILLVHGGIPRDARIKERFTDLSSLNDPYLRFEMMWGNPSPAAVIPAALQSRTNRFSFGRLQAQAFLQRLGCHTVIRGHQQVRAGFEAAWPEAPVRLFTLFSAGGIDNEDLPPDCPYRKVLPMALTLTHRDGTTRLSPWAIAYQAYANPAFNGFLRSPPELEFRKS